MVKEKKFLVFVYKEYLPGFEEIVAYPKSWKNLLKGITGKQI